MTSGDKTLSKSYTNRVFDMLGRTRRCITEDVRSLEDLASLMTDLVTVAKSRRYARETPHRDWGTRTLPEVDAGSSSKIPELRINPRHLEETSKSLSRGIFKCLISTLPYVDIINDGRNVDLPSTNLPCMHVCMYVRCGRGSIPRSSIHQIGFSFFLSTGIPVLALVTYKSFWFFFSFLYLV